jgi:sugar-phosphatase
MVTDTRTRTAEALLIDLDGTLVDSHASIVRAWDGWAASYGVDPARIRAIMPGRTAVSVMREVRPDLTDAVLAREQDDLLDRQVTDTAGVIALPGARRLLAALPTDRWALVTACDDRLARARLRAAGLPEPAVLVGCDTVPTSKPDPTGYLTAAARLGTDPAGCVVIEDAPAGVAAGLAAGMAVLALPPAAAELVTGGRVVAVASLAGVRVGVGADGLIEVEVTDDGIG